MAETRLALPRRPGRPVRRPFPFEEDDALLGITAGITVGEGSAYCWGRERRYKAVAVDMCDTAAVETVGKAWGVSVYPSSKGKCPKTRDNPTGTSVKAMAIGTRAEIIMRKYEPLIRETAIARKFRSLKCA